MGLFRSRIKRNREKAAEPPEDEKEARLPEEETGARTALAESARREVTAEARPNPDQPGWGRIAGQAIGKSREDHPQ
jgi:hypothetical protein